MSAERKDTNTRRDEDILGLGSLFRRNLFKGVTSTAEFI
jgi:hypothetical protein